jgi:hypothetical protein
VDDGSIHRCLARSAVAAVVELEDRRHLQVATLFPYIIDLI